MVKIGYSIVGSSGNEQVSFLRGEIYFPPTVEITIDGKFQGRRNRKVRLGLNFLAWNEAEPFEYIC